VHKKLVPEGKTVNAEFYKGVMDRLLKRIQRVRPAAFCSLDFFLLHGNAPVHKSASVCQFLTTPKKCYNPSSPPELSRLISATVFTVPQVEKKLKGLHSADVAEIQEAVSDELKKVQKEEFSAAFQKLYDRAKDCIYANGTYFELKQGMCFPRLSSIFKKISPKTFGPHCLQGESKVLGKNSRICSSFQNIKPSRGWERQFDDPPFPLPPKRLLPLLCNNILITHHIPRM
jgi:hypothetical protein